MGFLFKFISKINKSIFDFSNRGFTLREASNEPEKTFLVPSMWIVVPGKWIEQIGWAEGLNKNIVRCYGDGFSFWHGDIDDAKEWYCPYDIIERFKQPLKISSASPIIVIQYNQKKVECMLGNGADYIKSKLGA